MVTQTVLSDVESKMQKTVEKMKADFGTLRTGRASSAILENIKVDYYGTMTPLNQLGSIAAPEPRTLEIRPWDKGALQPIEKAIQKSDLGLNPNNDGTLIRIQIPALTEERRRDLIKVVKKMCEEFRVVIRNERRDAVERLKKSQKMKEISEDDLESAEQSVQKLTDLHIKKIDDLMAAKEKDLMEV